MSPGHSPGNALPLTRYPFDNRFIRDLPGDDGEPRRSRQVSGAAWSRAQPTPVRAPRLIARTRSLCDELGFEAGLASDDEFAAVMAGNRVLEGMSTWAACYGGHQFGQWAGQLGDGRVIGLGEIQTSENRRWELQLKGAGPTPYSRNSDGRAVMRSSLREFVCSEAMHALGVPTTRALSLVATGETVVRDMLYDGRPQPETGAIVCRVAPSFIRFGQFELPTSRGDTALLEKLIDFTIRRDFPQLTGPAQQVRAKWFHEICERTAIMVAHWMRVGFVHGVMNTDNMSVLGLTIDYGPYGWLEEFDPEWTPNTTDAQGRRYAYGRQPQIAHWNLACLAGAIAPLIEDHDALRAGLEHYASTFSDQHARMTGDKLGIANWQDADLALAQDLFALMHAAQLDFTRTFDLLARAGGALSDSEALRGASYSAQAFDANAEAISRWMARHAERLSGEAEPIEARRARMRAASPIYVARNWLAQEAIDALAQGDAGPLERLIEVLATPYEDQPGADHYAGLRPEWARNRAGCSMLSCSS
jgi:uncharacterized protein YdiU (UPF0061 family)